LERHDLSQFRGYVPRADGTYAFDTLDLFRTEPGRQAWLIRYGVTLAGFALTRPVESGGTSMYAFFIVRGLRRHGVGLQSARELLRLIPGVWGIAFQDENADAQPFWQRVATDAVADRWRLEKGTGPEGRPPDIETTSSIEWADSGHSRRRHGNADPGRQAHEGLPSTLW